MITYDRMNPDPAGLVNKLTMYAVLTYGIPALELSSAEAAMIVELMTLKDKNSDE